MARKQCLPIFGKQGDTTWKCTYGQWPVNSAHFLVQTADEVEPERYD